MAFTTTLHRGRCLVARHATTGDEAVIGFRDVPEAGDRVVRVGDAVVRFGPLKSDGVAWSPKGPKRRVWVEAPDAVRLTNRAEAPPPAGTIATYRMRAGGA